MKRDGDIVSAESLPCRYQSYNRLKKKMVWLKPAVDCGGDWCANCGLPDCGNCPHNDCASCGWNLDETMRRATYGHFETRPRIVGETVVELRSLHFKGRKREEAEKTDGDTGQGPA